MKLDNCIYCYCVLSRFEVALYIHISILSRAKSNSFVSYSFKNIGDKEGFWFWIILLISKKISKILKYHKRSQILVFRET